MTGRLGSGELGAKGTVVQMMVDILYASWEEYQVALIVHLVHKVGAVGDMTWEEYQGVLTVHLAHKVDDLTSCYNQTLQVVVFRYTNTNSILFSYSSFHIGVSGDHIYIGTPHSRQKNT